MHFAHRLGADLADLAALRVVERGGGALFPDLLVASLQRTVALAKVYGLALAVAEQIRVAAGSPLSLKQEDVSFFGHAIECRVNAEHHSTFRPSPGRIAYYHPPGGVGVRVDSAVYQGYSIPPNYDSLIGKLIVHGRNRTEALMRLRRSLDEFIVDGVDTTLPLFRTLVRNADVQNGMYDIHWLEHFLATGGIEPNF